MTSGGREAHPWHQHEAVIEVGRQDLKQKSHSLTTWVAFRLPPPCHPLHPPLLPSCDGKAPHPQGVEHPLRTRRSAKSARKKARTFTGNQAKTARRYTLLHALGIVDIPVRPNHW